MNPSDLVLYIKRKFTGSAFESRPCAAYFTRFWHLGAWPVLLPTIRTFGNSAFPAWSAPRAVFVVHPVNSTMLDSLKVQASLLADKPLPQDNDAWADK